MRDDDLRASSNIDDRRGGSGMARGGLGVGAVVVLTLLGWAFGIDPAVLIGGAEQATSGRAPVVAEGAPAQPGAQPAARAGAPDDEVGRFVARVLGETEDVWSRVLPEQTGRRYDPPVLVLFSAVTQSGCGAAQSAMGPFYCPLDRKLYLDTSFFQDMQRRMGGGGDFAYAYVIAHEVGHHLQNLVGVLPKVQSAQRETDQAAANALSVRTELMADCLAGVWANHMNERHRNLDEGDLREATNTAAAIGDDRLARSGGRAAVQDSFTHGSSEQRVRWLMTGLRSGTIASCDTFQGAR